MVGQGQNADGQYHAFRYSSGSVADLGTLGGFFSSASCINASGQVVGYADTTEHALHAFSYSNGTMKDLGTLGGSWSSAYGINASGQVVGSAYITGDVAPHAFLYSDGVMTDLNSLIDPASGCTLRDANAINDSGWIVGAALNSAGQGRAFLLTPAPEPSSFVLFGMGAIGLLAYVWQRRQQA